MQRDQYPDVSVVMPVRNGETYLEDAIRSILSQTLSTIELLIVLNGSTDSSEEIARRYSRLDPRVRVLHSPNPGTSNAMNWGVENARASWIARMDADDISLPTRLEKQLQFVRKNRDVSAVATHGRIISSTGRTVARFSGGGPTTREEFHRMREESLMYLLASSVMFSKNVSEAVGGHRSDYITAQDVDFWTRIADSHLILSIPEVLVEYRIHGSSASSRRYAEQIFNARCAAFNMRRRRRGLPEITLDEYRLIESQECIATRVHRSLSDKSHYFYRKGGSLLAEGNIVGTWWLACSAIAYPPTILRKLRNQRVFGTTLQRARALTNRARLGA